MTDEKLAQLQQEARTALACDVPLHLDPHELLWLLGVQAQARDDLAAAQAERDYWKRTAEWLAKQD